MNTTINELTTHKIILYNSFQSAYNPASRRRFLTHPLKVLVQLSFLLLLSFFNQQHDATLQVIKFESPSARQRVLDGVRGLAQALGHSRVVLAHDPRPVKVHERMLKPAHVVLHLGLAQDPAQIVGRYLEDEVGVRVGLGVLAQADQALASQDEGRRIRRRRVSAGVVQVAQSASRVTNSKVKAIVNDYLTYLGPNC
jgi:hypothetical protein